MAWSGGVFTRGPVDGQSGATLWADVASDGNAVISSSEHDTHDEILTAGINACVAKDGSNAMTGSLNMGSQKIVSMAAGTATGNGGRWDEDVSGISLDGTSLVVAFNGAATDLTLDLASIGSAGEMTLSTDQTVTGKKTFTTATTPITDLRILETTYHKLAVLTAGGAVSVDTTAYSRFFLNNNQAMTLTFTIPAASSDTDLGANFCTEGYIMMRNDTGHSTITLSVSATDTETIGSRPTGATELYSLVYQIFVMGSTRYVKFVWVSA